MKFVKLALLCATLVGCAQQPAKQDLLQNTKKLVYEGHATLYNNGAFEVPMTTIHIIPPGPGALDLVAELSGARARQSFQESLLHARESVALTRAGIEISVDAAQAVQQGTTEIAGGARNITRFGALMIGNSQGMVSDVVGASVMYSGKAYNETDQAGSKLAQDSLAAGAQISASTTDVSKDLLAVTLELAGDTSKASQSAAGKHASYATDRFVKGYAALPNKLEQRINNVGESASLGKFVDAYQHSNEWRSEQLGNMSDIVVETAANYTKDIGKSFKSAAGELSEGEETGYTLAMLKSLRWVVQGIFWDATIKPVGKLAGASLGYVTVNAVAFPALITYREGVAVADVAVEVTWNSAASAYDVTAPSATAALAGMFSAMELVGGKVLAGGELVIGTTATAATYGVGKAAAAATAGGGFLSGKTVQYVGAPLSAAGIAVGGSTFGVVAGATKAVAGAGVATVGVIGEGATDVAGYTAAGTALVGGSTASVVTGTALGTYELSKAVVVPTGYELGSGLVLGYGTLSQLSAQAVLAVSDASYMVLSLEGPNWVLYAVKGAVDNGENLISGAMLDLKAMQRSGETFTAVPVSDKEMKKIISTLPGQLPIDIPHEHL